MSEPQSFGDPQCDADVLICGGGMAGLTLALQLRQRYPQLRVTVIERTARPLPDGAHKVGESSVELGSQYLERLGLTEYLLAEHLIKFGLRFFPGGGRRPLEKRPELGPANEPVVRSYQLDRGKFETDVRGMIEQQGATLIEGAMVRDVEIASGDTPHTVAYEKNGERHELSCRWFVDASGRNSFLKRRKRLKRGSRHIGNAGWFRVEGRVDLGEMLGDDGKEFTDAPFAGDRWRSTNHLMGEGYWAWIIPLAGDRTSIGLVTHDENHAFERVRKHEHVMAFFEEHEPALAKRLEDAKVLDFRCLKSYSHNVARSWHADRWAIVGEAGAFVDPLYSPGTDFIAYANSFTEEVIRCDLEGGDLQMRCTEMNAQYKGLIGGSVELYQTLAPVYGHARAMTAKVYWDNFVYWSFACQFFLQGMYRLSGKEFRDLNAVGGRYVELSGYMQAIFRAWAVHAPEEKPVEGFISMPAFPSLQVDAHLDLQKQMSHEETMEYMRKRLAEAEQMAAELIVRVPLEFGPELAKTILDEAGYTKWSVNYDAGRPDAEPLIGLARRRGLTTVVRDVERNLGRIQRHEQWEEALQLLYPAQAQPATGSTVS